MYAEVKHEARHCRVVVVKLKYFYIPQRIAWKKKTREKFSIHLFKKMNYTEYLN